MRRFATLITFALLTFAVVRANDGVFYASGSTLLPLEETQVALRKELLKFYVVDHGYAQVEVNFEFFNPGKEKKVTVGFVTPPAEGDVSEDQANSPFITDFTVEVNGEKIGYKLKKLPETSFKLGKAAVTGNDFVYYFPVTFKSGTNKIRHTYRFRGGASVDLLRDFQYQITTGKRWANKQIDDFELQIHPDAGIFTIISSFSKTRARADWRIVGDGVIQSKERTWFGDESPRVRLFHLNSGYLSFKARNFRPDNDLFFAEYNWPAGWASMWCTIRSRCPSAETFERLSPYFRLRPNMEYGEIENFSAKEYKYVRNYFYALRGLPFKDPELQRFYGQFFWYKPVAGLQAADIALSREESEFVAKVAELESKKSK